MDKIYNIKYVDAYYSYEKNITQTKLSLFEAYGYVEKNADNLVIIFIKKLGIKNEKTIKENEDIIKGLVIPYTALVSAVRTFKTNILKNLAEGSSVTVKWRDLVFVANLPRYDCSTMYTEGILFKIASDHIVLKNPKTIRIYPYPVKNHPESEIPSYLIIPISFITNITILKK